jgi:hypothetical protein
LTQKKIFSASAGLLDGWNDFALAVLEQQFHLKRLINFLSDSKDIKDSLLAIKMKFLMLPSGSQIRQQRQRHLSTEFQTYFEKGHEAVFAFLMARADKTEIGRMRRGDRRVAHLGLGRMTRQLENYKPNKKRLTQIHKNNLKIIKKNLRQGIRWPIV